MGCTSSTPLVTTGSNMLKAASHVAADATKSAEDAVEDVAQTLGKTFDTAKESVGTAVTGMANDLGNAIKEKTDETKANLMEKLHLNNGHERESTTDTSDKLMKRGATGTTMLTNDADDGDDENDDDDAGNDDIMQRIARGATPVPVPVQQDNDSLKTTASEPEIEQALANRNENSPPTPKPSLSELERLSAELHDFKTDSTAADGHDALPLVSHVSIADTTAQLPAEEKTRQQQVQPRPGTTEWEKYADLLAKDRKFHPNEIALRRRIFGPNIMGLSTLAGLTGTGIAAVNGMAATLIETAGVEAGTGAGLGSGVGEGSTGIATKAMAMTTLTPRNPMQRTKTKATIVPPQYYRDFPRPAAGENRLKNDDGDETSDRYNGSNSSSQPTSRYSGKPLRKRLTKIPTTSNVKKMHRQLTTLMGYGADRSTTLPLLRGHAGRKSPKHAPMGRNFDFNPNRMRVGSPVPRRRGSQGLLPIRFGGGGGVSGGGEPSTRPIKRFVNRIESPLKVTPLKQRSCLAIRPSTPKPHISTSLSSSPSRIGLHSLGGLRSPRPSTTNNNVVVIKSSCTTPTARSPSRNSLSNISVGVLENGSTTQLRTCDQHVGCALGSRLRSSSPLPDTIDHDKCRLNGGYRTPLGLTHSPVNNNHRNTSSFLSSPRTSSPLCCARKSFMEFDDKENKSAFIADLGAATENRQLLTPSSYKERERCAVCFNKYVVK